MCHNRPSAGLVRLPSFQLIRVDSSARANVAIRKQNPLGKNETLVLYHTGILNLPCYCTSAVDREAPTLRRLESP